MKRIDSLLSPLVKGLGIEEAVRFEGLKAEWTKIFREPLSLHMSPSRLSNGVLLINVDTPVWLHQINFYRVEILQNLTAFGIRDVRFRIGRIHTKESRAPHRPQLKKNVLSNAASRQIEETVSKMEEGPVKESIRRAMEKALSKKISES